MKNTTHFKSCFIADVAFSNDEGEIVLNDTSHSEFVIKTDDESLVKKFKDWFKTVFLSCKPQQITVVKYCIEEKSEYEVFSKVLDLIYA